MAGDKLATAAAADTALLREYELSDDDFQRIRRLVRERLGISLAESKRELVYGRLSRRLRALKLRDFSAYLQRVESADADELQHFCNAITTHLTSFFREEPSFRISGPAAAAGARAQQRQDAAHAVLVSGMLYRGGAVFDRDGAA